MIDSAFPPSVLEPAGRAQRRQAIVLGLLAFAAPIVGVFAPHGEAALILIVAALLLLCGGQRAAIAAVPRPLAALLAAFVLWGLVSALWSQPPTRAAVKAAQLAGMFAVGLYVIGAALSLPSGAAARIRQALLAGGGVAVATLMEEALSGGFLLKLMRPQLAQDGIVAWWNFKPGVAILVILVWAVVDDAVKAGRPALALGTVPVIAFCGAWIGGGTALLALAVAGLLFLVARCVKRPGVSLAIAAIALMTVAGGPWLAGWILDQPSLKATVDSIARSATHRLIIWDFVTSRILEHPLLGWGLDASRAIPGGSQVVPGMGERLPLHPHNALLQWQLELGIVGTLIGAALVLWTIARSSRHSPGAQAMAFATFTFAAASWSIWQSWWMATQFIVAALACAILRPSTAPVAR